jgi:Na+-translocating ferredoxin:NAD+ oxidoreductase RnfD subunit
MTARTIAVGGTSYPLVLPTIRDPRLHVAAVIITIHVLGQVGLHFAVSIPQILAAILASAILEVVLTFRQSRAFVWPASAMLTGSGVALILRVIGTPPDQPWTVDGWHVFAGVAAFSLLTKYVIRYRGNHVFNPSNIGLVVAFVVLGSTRVEPLDFWWSSPSIWLVAAYAVIVGGGLLITRRLRLLGLAAAFWFTLLVTLGVLAASGHCMTANWAFAPVCGVDYWRVIVTSPEVMVFLFFMITDPKTVPTGQVGRVIFGVLVAIVSTLLMAPQTDEFGTKVALLAGLVVVCAARPLLDRLVPEPGAPTDRVRPFATRLTLGDGPRGTPRAVARPAVTAVAVLMVGAAIVAAGTLARGPAPPDSAAVLDRIPHQVDPSTFPAITVGADVTDWNHEIEGQGARDIVVTLAENLELENQALLRADGSILRVVDHGDRLAEMEALLRESPSSGPVVIERYRFDSIHMSLREPFGVQSGLSLALDARGTLTAETYDSAGALLERQESPFATTFLMRRALGDRWMTVAVIPSEGGS